MFGFFWGDFFFETVETDPMSHCPKVMSIQEFEHPDLFWSLSSCMKPLMSIAQTEKTMASWRMKHQGLKGKEKAGMGYTQLGGGFKHFL